MIHAHNIDETKRAEQALRVCALKDLKDIWCERGDSNPHALRRQILS
jgi:hypothetical protein